MDVNGNPDLSSMFKDECLSCGCLFTMRYKGEDGLCRTCTWGPTELKPDIKQQIYFLQIGVRAHRTLMNNWRHDGQHRYAKWAEEALEKNLAEIAKLEAQLNPDRNRITKGVE